MAPDQEEITSAQLIEEAKAIFRYKRRCQLNYINLETELQLIQQANLIKLNEEQKEIDILSTMLNNAIEEEEEFL